MEKGKDKGKKGETEADINNVAPAWTKLAKGITCRNHGKESTTNSYLLRLQARIGEFRMASEWEIGLGCRVWSRMGGRIGE